jgi:riboflavin kinase/FMN adenylyltransferase
MPDPERSEPGVPQLAAGAVLTVGSYDGVHRGHQDIVRRVVACGVDQSLPTALITFSPHPLDVVNPSAAPMLLTPGDEQLVALADTGVDHVVVLPFTRTLAQYSAETFVREVLLQRYRLRTLVVGYDHGLGRGREGDAATLTALGRRLGFTVEVVPPTLDEIGVPVSSSGIRTAIAHGDLARAAAALGRPYALSGRVAHGSQRGRDLGFPTLNIALASAKKLLPPEGVYAVRGVSRFGAHGGMMNLGGRPTFGELERQIEVHLFDASGDWYDAHVTVELVRRLRDVKRFDGVEALVKQLQRDADAARIALTQA